MITMKRSLLYLTILCCFISTSALAKDVQTVASLSRKALVLSNPVDYHITASENVLVSSTINIQHEDAWVFFDNVRPSAVINSYSSYIKINGASLVNGNNAKVAVYKQGTVVIPHASSYKPLTIYTADNFQGESTNLGIGYNTNLGGFDNNIRSFVLKRGYMATFANNADGTGYSRSFVAQDDDIVFSVVPEALYGRTSFIRVFQWKYVSKKGWCTTDGSMDTQAGLTESTWCYTWSADRTSTNNLEYIPIKQHLYWPGWDQINSITGSTAVLGYNEPEHSEQHDEGAYTVATAISHFPEFLNSGMRVGSASPTDMSWISSFISSSDAACYRVDFVAMHAYWGGLSAATWYSTLKSWYTATGRPLWITEWNNGANWTTETTWPSTEEAQFAKQLSDIKAILYVMDTASFVERYSIYNWVEDKRAMVLNGALTPAGEYYKNNHPDLAYNPAMQVIPKVPSITTPTLTKSFSTTTGDITFTITDNNGELSDSYTLQRMFSGGLYDDVAAIPNRTFDLDTTAITYVYTPTDEERDGAYYRIKYQYLNGKVLFSAAISASGYASDAWTLNDWADGDYYIVNAASNSFLTNSGTTIPAYAVKDTTTSAQIWTLYKDTTGRYKITSKSSGGFLNESAVFSTGEYYPTWNTYNLYRRNGTDSIAIQNADKAGTYYWTTTTTKITGKGSSAMAGFPFRLLSTAGAAIIPAIQYKNTQYMSKVAVSSGDSLVLDPQPLTEGGSWLWNTGDTTRTLTLNQVSVGDTYTVRQLLGGETRQATFTVTVNEKNTLADGYYYFCNQTDNSYLTNDGTLNPLFTTKQPTNENARIWYIRKDTTTNRYAISTCEKGNRSLNEYGRFTSSAYSANWNSFDIHQLAGTDYYAIQNGGSGGDYYWIISSSLITGKGSATIKDYPFRFIPANPILTIYPYINSTYTDSLAVSSGTTVILQPAASIPGGTWRWDTGDSTNYLTVTQTGNYSVTYYLNGDSVSYRFKVEFHLLNTLAPGTYYIKNALDGSYLTNNGTSYPEFQGKELFDTTSQLWTISKDATTSRYKITSNSDAAVFLDEYGRYNESTYYPIWNSFNLYNQTGTDLYAIQNGGSAGTMYWTIINSMLRGKGSSSMSDFPFEIVDPANDPTELAATAMASINGGEFTQTSYIETPVGSTVTLKMFVTVKGGQFSWSNGDTTESILLNTIQESGSYSVSYIYGTDTLTSTFSLYTYILNPLANGNYYIINASTNKYLSYVSSTIKPSFSIHYDAIALAQAWTFELDSTTNRYKITSLKNPSCFLTASATFTTDTYSNTLHTYEVYGEVGTEKLGIRNGGSSGTMYWTAGASNITGTGSSTIAFPFLIEPYTTGLDNEWGKEDIAVWPNPVQNEFILAIPEDATFSLVTLDGKVLLTENCVAGRNTISIGSLPSGSYLGEIKTDDGHHVVKILKTK